MQLKKIVLSTLLFTALLFALPTISMQAATWHSGMPKILQGKWKTKRWRPYKKFKQTGVGHLSIGKKHLTYSSAVPPIDPQGVLKVHYRKSGHIYHVIGRDFSNAPAGGIKQTFTIKVYNRHKIYFRLNEAYSVANNHIYYKY